MRRAVCRWLTPLLFCAALPVSAGAGDVPDQPTPRPAKDRITQYQLYAMHQVTPAYPPYRFEVVTPGQPPLTASACLRVLQQVFTARKRPQEPEHTQTVMLLQWLSIQPDAKPDFAKWVGCWPTGSPFYLAWQQHRTTTPGDDPSVPPYWYRPWTDGMKPMSPENCLALIRGLTKQRHVELIKWYQVRPDPPPDLEKRVGCMPAGFDPEKRER